MVVLEIPIDQQFLKYSDQSVWHQQACQIQISFRPHSDAQFAHQVAFTM